MYAASASSRSPVISASSAASSRGSSGAATADAGGLEHRVDPLPELRLGQHAGEAVDRLAADDREDHRDALHPERLGEPRVGVDVDLGRAPRRRRPRRRASPAPGESCLHGSHQSAQKSRITGVVSERSSTSVWKVGLGDVDDRRRRAGARRAAGAAAGRPPGRRPAAGGAAWRAGVRCGRRRCSRSALRSTAPRVKIDGVVRGSLMVI